MKKCYKAPEVAFVVVDCMGMIAGSGDTTDLGAGEGGGYGTATDPEASASYRSSLWND